LQNSGPAIVLVGSNLCPAFIIPLKLSVLFWKVRRGTADRFGVTFFNVLSDGAHRDKGIQVLLELDQPDVRFIKTLDQYSGGDFFQIFTISGFFHDFWVWFSGEKISENCIAARAFEKPAGQLG
jgi:hypothetical protein